MVGFPASEKYFPVWFTLCTAEYIPKSNTLKRLQSPTLRHPELRGPQKYFDFWGKGKAAERYAQLRW